MNLRLPRSLVALVAWSLILSPTATARQAGSLVVRYLDVGQADAALVTCPDGAHHLLIDSGDTRYPGSSKAFRAAMLEAFPAGSAIDVAIASHPHQDHIGNMEWVLKTYRVGTYIDNGEKGDTATFGRLDTLRRKLVSQHQLKYVNGRESSGEDVSFCPNVTVRLLEPWASDTSLKDTNDRSVAVRVDYGSTSFLFMGDIEGRAEDAILDKAPALEQALLDVDVLKVGHHGSDTSSTAAFLMAVTPKVAVISSGAKQVGTNVGYKHPRLSSLRRLVNMLKPNALNGKVDAYDKANERWVRENRREGVWLTTDDGDIVIRSDGTTLGVTTAQ